MTIEVFTQLTARDDQLKQMYQLRKRFVVDILKWQGRKVYNGMEFDEYDAPPAIYILKRDRDGIGRGTIRLSPTSQPYMLAENWPQLVTKCALPKSDSIWELTRLCVEQTEMMETGIIVSEMLSAVEQMAEDKGITELWYVSPKERVMTLVPHNFEMLGPEIEIEYEKCSAFRSDPADLVHPSMRTHEINVIGRNRIKEAA